MRARFAAVLVVLVGMGCVFSACGGIVDPSKNQLETLTGTLIQGQSLVLGPYNISKSGEYVVTLTSITPALPVNFYIGVGFGLSNGSGGCSLIASNTFAVAGRQVLGTSITPGAYCIAIADVGYLSAGTTYTYAMQFSHP